jgi:hypothetical protein
MKKPKANEWWQSKDDADRVYICGFDHQGDPVYSHAEGAYVDTIEMNYFLDEYEHLPDCTGWDWEPKQTKPPVTRVTLHRIMIQKPDGEWHQIVRSNIPEWRWDRWHIVETFEVEIPC